MAQFSVPLHRLVDQASADVEKQVRKVTLDLFGAIVERSPVDTGQFKANWFVAEGSPNLSTTLNVDPSGADAQARIAQFAVTAEIGGKWYLTNALPYAYRLEYGWSKQAPTGMVRLSIQDAIRYSLRNKRST